MSGASPPERRTRDEHAHAGVVTADARLIAAAPEMAATLAMFVRWDDDTHGDPHLFSVAMSNARALLARIEDR